jgi:hypothetical protein
MNNVSPEKNQEWRLRDIEVQLGSSRLLDPAEHSFLADLLRSREGDLGSRALQALQKAA